MSILSGCQEGKATPKLEEIICPECGDIIEVFVGMGANNAGILTSDAKCEKCGHTVMEGTLLTDYQKA